MEWNVSAIDDKGQSGEASHDNYKFELRGPPLQKPKFDKPYSKFVRELTWQAPAFVKDYSVDLKYLNPKTKKWETIEKNEFRRD